MGIGLASTSEDANSRMKFNDEKAAFLDNINNNSNVIVYNTDHGYNVLHGDLKNTKQYSLGDTYFYDDDTIINDNFTKILEENPDKKVYLVNWNSASERNKPFEDNFNLEKVYDAGLYSFNLVKG